MAREFGATEIGHETADKAGGAVSEAIEFAELSLGDIILIQGAVELIFDFSDRPFGCGEKLDELAIAATLETLRDIRAGRNSSAADLVDQSKVR